MKASIQPRQARLLTPKPEANNFSLRPPRRRTLGRGERKPSEAKPSFLPCESKPAYTGSPQFSHKSVTSLKLVISVTLCFPAAQLVEWVGFKQRKEEVQGGLAAYLKVDPQS